mmetsp:Transcript_24251/g.46054  ORF Transcript_24251/g.46054 Transcript_24251/m.46054 type:complete len:342 (+) Transcript_24251:86-1111(+)
MLHSSSVGILAFISACNVSWGTGLVIRESSSPVRDSSDVHSTPPVIIAGIGDSGTRGVKELMQTLGLRMCNEVNENQDNIRTSFMRESEMLHGILHLIRAADSTLSANYQRNVDAFQHLLAWQKRHLEATKDCALRTSKDANAVWGLKNPAQLYMWPITEHAYANRSKLLLVVRDPRDICTSSNKEQFNAFCESLIGRPCEYESDCYSFWAKVWYDVSEHFVPNGNVKLVRIEDLAVPEPAVARPKVECMLEFAGLGTHSDQSRTFHSYMKQRDVEKALDQVHHHSSTYMGRRHGATAWYRKYLASHTKHHKDPLVKQMMLHLGYDPSSFKLLEPKEAAMC